MTKEQEQDIGLIERLLTKIAPVERQEVPAVITAMGLFFCMFAGYFAVRPVRETIGTIIGRETVADLYAVTWIASVAIVPIYGWLVGRLRRSVLLPCIYGFIAVALAVVGFAFETGAPGKGLGMFFYVFISVLNLFFVSVFWSFLLELFHSSQAKRLFGIIAAGGTAGALVGPVVTDLSVERLGNGGVLMLGAALFVAAILMQRRLLAIWKGQLTPAPERTATGESGVRGDRAIGGNPFAGFWLVLKSPYLLMFAAFVFLLASVSTFLYFEQLRLVEIAYPDVTERTRVFARIDWIVQSLTIAAQLFITGRIASRLGLVVLLMIVPVAMIFGFVALAAAGTFMTLAVVFILRRAGEYAFVRPGREMLFSRLDTETKYKAKNLIDVPVYRFADLVAAQFQQLVGSLGIGPAVMSLIGAGVAACWAVTGWWLGRRHDRGTDAA
ncbi:MAG: MFS transporter [Gammaproteobacteria bacterium]|nr:MAG: MFS transporter [Gammaproteobacteria bacterium]